MSARPIARETFRGKSYRIIWRRLPDTKVYSSTGKTFHERTFGLTDDPGSSHREMCIDPSQTERNLLSTLVHEALHACLWDVAEDAVRETSDDIARFLANCGFRRERSAAKKKGRHQ
jgi:hypothetical protein